MLKEIRVAGQNPDKPGTADADVKFPRAEEVFEWTKSNPSLTTDAKTPPDEIDLHLGFPSSYGGNWGGDGRMMRIVEFNPFRHGRPETIMISENSTSGNNIIRLQNKTVKASVWLGHPDGDFGTRYSLADDGSWYREPGRLKTYQKKESAPAPTAQEMLGEMQIMLDKYRGDEKNRPTAEQMLEELRMKLERESEQGVVWHPSGTHRKVTDIYSRDQIEDIVRREGSVYTKKRA